MKGLGACLLILGCLKPIEPPVRSDVDYPEYYEKYGEPYEKYPEETLELEEAPNPYPYEEDSTTV